MDLLCKAYKLVRVAIVAMLSPLAIAFHVMPSKLEADAFEMVFLGTTSILFRDEENSILIDGFCSRPSLPKLALGKIASDPSRVKDCLERAGVSKLSALFVAHSHYDHVMDAPLVAKLTGAHIYGSRSTLRIAVGEGVSDSQLTEVLGGNVVKIGSFRVHIFETPHGPPTLFKGTVKRSWSAPQRFSRYRVGKNYSYYIEHQEPEAPSVLIVPSAGVQTGAFGDFEADVVFLSIGMLGWQPRLEFERYWKNAVLDVGATEVVPIHWDDFRVPLSRPLVQMPFPPDRVEKSLQELKRLSTRDDIGLILPKAFQPLSFSR